MEFSVPSLAARLRTEADAYLLLEELRWEGKPECPHCGSERAYFLTPANGTSRMTRRGTMSERRVWKCAACRKQFTVTVGTIFHGSKISLRSWLFVVFEMCASKNGVSAREVERKYGITAKSAWFMLHRIREAMKRDGTEKMLRGTIVADETFFGGLARNRHAKQPNPPKVAVLTLVNKDTGEARSRVIPNVRKHTLKWALQRDVHNTATLHTDSAGGYREFGEMIAEHQWVNHMAGEYVRHGKIGTNPAENFFSQLKRSIDGTHHHVSAEHLHRYLAEFDYRYSTRRETDSVRTVRLVKQTKGRRLAYRPLASARRAS